MNFDEYQQAIEKFAVYPRDEELTAVSYLALGLNGEAGEVAEQVKKAIRNDGQITDERRAKILDEIGDVLWYAARIASEFDVSFGEIAQQNVEKLEQRRKSKNLKHE
ncbi:MAG: nucleoside triphosphate pyrophosphohydrolase family protein [Acidobacteriota bacterium]|nr:nucleoside triphosphate pyrophosphohydrolase family protein [Acidobacteriota bacterium]